MTSNPLYAPWRIDYIRSIDKGEPGRCFLCDAANAATPEERRERLVLWQSAQSVVLINRYPYTNGHLLIAPRAHKADFEELSPEELCDINVQTTAVLRLLKHAMSPQGFNIGINLGRAAGAGVPGTTETRVGTGRSPARFAVSNSAYQSGWGCSRPPARLAAVAAHSGE